MQPPPAAPQGLMVWVPDLSTATDDELVATGGFLTEQLHRVYRELHRRNQLRAQVSFTPPADISY